MSNDCDRVAAVADWGVDAKAVNKSERTEGAILVARRDGEYYFVSSVFKHDDDFQGCTGTVCCPVTEEMMEDMLSTDNLVDRYRWRWEERYKDDVDGDCEACNGWIDEDGCEDCGYPSVESFCAKIGQYDGSDAVIDDPGRAYAEDLDAVCEDNIEYADTTGCGRIFGSFNSDKPMTPDYFDEVFNRNALVVCLAYEDGAVDYDYACKMIFND